MVTKNSFPPEHLTPMVPIGWEVEKFVSSRTNGPAIRFKRSAGDPERDWIVVEALKNEDGAFTEDEILLERGAVAALEHELFYAPLDDKGLVEARLAFAQRLELAGRAQRNERELARQREAARGE